MARHAPAATALLLLTLLTTSACAPLGPTNPSFPITHRAAARDLERMERAPVRLHRPVVVIGGWGDVLGLPPERLARQLREATGDERIIAVGMGWITSFPDARQRVLDAVAEHFPSEDPLWTTRVDVVGFSMGGLVARDAASPADEADGPQRRLNVARLFTIATPHRGAAAAEIAALGNLALGMRPGSAFLASLDAALGEAPYTLLPYARLDDHIVGTAHSAPQGLAPWWVAAPPLELAHAHAYRDPRIVADIARRLRGEAPLTTEPPAPLPGEEPAGNGRTSGVEPPTSNVQR